MLSRLLSCMHLGHCSNIISHSNSLSSLYTYLVVLEAQGVLHGQVVPVNQGGLEHQGVLVCLVVPVIQGGPVSQEVPVSLGVPVSQEVPVSLGGLEHQGGPVSLGVLRDQWDFDCLEAHQNQLVLVCLRYLLVLTISLSNTYMWPLQFNFLLIFHKLYASAGGAKKKKSYTAENIQGGTECCSCFIFARHPCYLRF